MKHKTDGQEIITVTRSGENKVTQVVLTDKNPIAMSVFVKRGHLLPQLSLLELNIKSALKVIRDAPGAKKGEEYDLLIAAIEELRDGGEILGGNVQFFY